MNTENGKYLSANAYLSMRCELARCQRQVLDVFKGSCGSLSANEVSKKLPANEVDNRNTRARIRELRDYGLLTVDHIDKDPVSNKMVAFYRVTFNGEIPMPLSHKPTRKQLEAEIERLRSRNDALEKKVLTITQIAEEAANHLIRLEQYAPAA